MKKFADRMNEIGEGIFQVLNEKKNELENAGRTVYNFSVGTPDFEPEEYIRKAVSEAALDPENYKYALGDLPELTDAVIRRFENRYGVKLSSQEITSVYGSQEGIAHIGMVLCDRNDVVLVPNPGYPVFGIGPGLAGAEVVTYDLLKERGYLPDLTAIPEEIAERAKFIIVSYPLNPVCKAAPESFYEELIAWAQKYGVWVVHDNAYSDIIFDGREGKSFLSYHGAKDVGVEFYSLSKSYNYTGARVGFLVGNVDVVTAFRKLRSQIDYGTFLPVQYGAIAALSGPDEVIIKQCREYEKRRNALCDGLSAIGWKVERSEGTMFVWTEIPDHFQEDKEFVLELFEKSGVLCTPGSSFGSLGSGHVRFALVHPVEKIEEAVSAINDCGILKK